MQERTVPTHWSTRLLEGTVALVLVSAVLVAATSWFTKGDGGLPGDDIEQVFIMNADGTGLRHVPTHPGARVATPAWSPDGRSLVVCVGGGANMDEPANLWIIDIETLEARRLTEGIARDHLPSWSPDGSTIAFIRHAIPMGSAPSTLYTIKVDGTGLLQLTEGRTQTTPASWSPDGQRLVFASDRHRDWKLYVMDPDGSHVEPLETLGVEPAWSPDGRSIVYMSEPNMGDFEILKLDLETREVSQLTHAAGNDFAPQWSPDGRKIIFISERSRRPELYQMNSDGSDLVNLSESSGVSALRGAYSPNGKQIAFFGLVDPEE